MSFEAESRCCQLNKLLWRRANQKKSNMEKIEEITENSSSVRYFEFEKQQKKREDSLEQKKFVTCK